MRGGNTGCKRSTTEGKRWQLALDNFFEPLILSRKAISLIFLLTFEGWREVLFPVYTHHFNPSPLQNDVDFLLYKSQLHLATHNQRVEGGGEETRRGHAQMGRAA